MDDSDMLVIMVDELDKLGEDVVEPRNREPPMRPLSSVFMRPQLAATLQLLQQASPQIKESPTSQR